MYFERKVQEGGRGLARPTKLTKKIQEDICRAVRAGNYIETAAAHVGINKTTLYDWMKRGAREKERIAKNPRARVKKSEEPYVEFSNAIEKALADAEVRDVAIIANAAKENWQAAAWRLERKFKERWGRNDYSRETERINAVIDKTKKEVELIEERIKLLKGDAKDTSLLESLIEAVIQGKVAQGDEK